jgi:predicted transposase/invertase (TIGR01784 family)
MMTGTGLFYFRSRRLEPKNANIYRSLLNSSQIQCVYLNELGDSATLPIGLRVIQLALATKKQMLIQAKQLIEQVQQLEVATLPKQEIIDMVATIAVYRFSELSRAEVEAMLGLSLEETRFYQDAKAEGKAEGVGIGELNAKLKMITKLLDRGLSPAEVADIVELTVEQVNQVALR